MRRVERITDERFHSSKRRSATHQPERIKEAFSLAFTADKIEGDYSSDRLHLAFRDLMVVIIFQARIINTRNLVMTAQGLGQTQSVSACGAHPNIQRLYSPRQKISGCRIEGRANAQIDSAYALNIVMISRHRACSQVGMPAQILRGAVNYCVYSVSERLLEHRSSKRVVDYRKQTSLPSSLRSQAQIHQPVYWIARGFKPEDPRAIAGNSPQIGDLVQTDKTRTY